jgi:hypothetical protein
VIKTYISKEDLISIEEFAKVRTQKRESMGEIKKNRRVALGPEASLYFENFDTLWWQIQEMLFIEKGGNAQIEDELLAYNPLMPQGQELVATFMIEINDPIHRAMRLSELGGIEECLFLRFAGHTIKAIPEEDPNRTTESGKTSSVHFVRWTFTFQQIADFSIPFQDVIAEVAHPKFQEKSLLPEPVRLALSKDFAE